MWRRVAAKDADVDFADGKADIQTTAVVVGEFQYIPILRFHINGDFAFVQDVLRNRAVFDFTNVIAHHIGGEVHLKPSGVDDIGGAGIAFVALVTFLPLFALITFITFISFRSLFALYSLLTLGPLWPNVSFFTGIGRAQ